MPTIAAPHSRALNLPPTNLPPTHHRPWASTMAAPPPPPASPLSTLTPIVPRNPRIPRRGPSQHKGEPENHAQALEASPSRALTRPTKPTARLGHTIHPHPAPVAALAVAVGASQRQTVAVGPSRPTGPLGPNQPDTQRTNGSSGTPAATRRRGPPKYPASEPSCLPPMPPAACRLGACLISTRCPRAQTWRLLSN